MYKILIRPLILDDASRSFQWRNDEEIWRYTGSRPDIHITEEIERNWVTNKLNETNSKCFAVEVDDVYVGNVQLTSITKNEAEFHIFIGDKYFWGKGISFSAIQQILRYADNILNLERVYLRVNPENVRAIRLYEKCGFIKRDDSVLMDVFLKSRLLPAVSVFCMVYNHEKFIKECLDSLLSQKCLFDFEIVLGEDFSNDSSRQIILQYQEKYPGKFKLFLHDENIGAHKNQEIILKNCKGEFIAICEGDDYWTDPYKLQKQLDFLQSSPEYNLCGHYVTLFNNGVLTQPPLMKETDYNFMDIGGKNLRIPTASLFYRNNISYPEWMNEVYGGDRAIIYLNALMGKIKMMNFLGAVYRIHERGIEQRYKKDKFSLPIRNINEESIYYELSVVRLHKQQIFKRILRNHLYILYWSIRKMKVKIFSKYFYSLITKLYKVYGKRIMYLVLFMTN